jgi:hypothetical protein
MKSQRDRFTGGSRSCYPAAAGFAFMLRVQVKQSQDILWQNRLLFSPAARSGDVTVLSVADQAPPRSPQVVSVTLG